MPPEWRELQGPPTEAADVGRVQDGLRVPSLCHRRSVPVTREHSSHLGRETPLWLVPAPSPAFSAGSLHCPLPLKGSGACGVVSSLLDLFPALVLLPQGPSPSLCLAHPSSFGPNSGITLWRKQSLTEPQPRLEAFVNAVVIMTTSLY